MVDRIINGHENSSINSCCVINNTEYIITGGGNDGQLKIHNTNTVEPAIVLPKVHTRSINAIDICTNNDYFISASKDNLVTFDLVKKTPGRHLINKPTNFSNYQAVNHEILDCKILSNDLLISCGVNHYLNFFDLRQLGKYPHFSINIGDDNLNSMDHANNIISLGSSNGNLYQVDIRNQQLICNNGQQPIIFLSNYEDSRLVNYANGDIILSDTKSQVKINIGSLHYKINSKMVDNIVINGTEEGKVQLWRSHLATKSVSKLPDLCISSDSAEGRVLNVYTNATSLIATSGDGHIYVWDDMKKYFD